jgi:glycerol-3-phosphate O-acyltransferase
MSTEAEFAVALAEHIARMIRETGYNPQRFRQKVTRVGAVAAMKALMVKTGPSIGHRELLNRRRFDLLFENLVLEQRFAPLFTDAEREAADRWLEAAKVAVLGDRYQGRTTT